MAGKRPAGHESATASGHPFQRGGQIKLIIRPTSVPLAGATAAAHFLSSTGLFNGQSNAFFDALFALARQADQAVRECDGN